MNVWTSEPELVRASAPVARRTDVRPALAVLAAAAVAILVQSLWIPVDADVSWLITLCERMLSGDRLYIDILEVNPPASVWLYLPLVWLAKVIGAKPEAVVVGAFVAAAIASISATMKITARLDDSPPPVWLAAVLGFVSLVLPMALFAQREHAALLLALPSLAALALIAEGKRLSRRALMASGLAAGAIVVIKPHFLLAVAVPALWAALKRRSLMPVLPGIGAGIAIIAAYALAILLLARPYLDWVPVIARTYGPMHDAWWKVFLGPSLYPAILLVLAVLLRPQRIPPLAMAWALGAAGFLVAAFAQAKNYPNHWLPESGLALAATFAILAMPAIDRGRRALVAAALAFVGLSEAYHWAILPDPAVASAVERLAPPSPKVIALSPQLTTGHPVTRNVGGTWAGSRAGLFTASGARFVGLKDESTRRIYREDIRSFENDVRKNSPDVVLVLTSTKSWLIREPEIARAMRGYRYAETAGDTEIWLKR
jgi:hypothetical protein